MTQCGGEYKMSLIKVRVMNLSLERPTLVWMQTGEIAVDTALAGDITTDVCVVGSGNAGSTTACVLLKEGKSVVIKVDGPVKAEQA